MLKRIVLKRIAIPAIVLGALLAIVRPPEANAAVRFGVQLGWPVYTYPAYPYYRYPNYYYYPYGYPYGGSVYFYPRMYRYHHYRHERHERHERWEHRGDWR